MTINIRLYLGFKEDERRATKALQHYQQEYSEKFRELETRLDDVRKKQLGMDTYITVKAEALAKEAEDKLLAEYLKKVNGAEAAFTEKETELRRIIGIYRRALGIVAAFALFLTVFLIVRWSL